MTDLLEQADRAVTAYFLGEIKSKMVIRNEMEILRSYVNEEKRKRAKDETQRITKERE